MAHGQSIVAWREKCEICRMGMTEKERKSRTSGYEYGITFGKFYNKRHSIRGGNSVYTNHRYFTDYICMSCICNIEEKLGVKFKRE
jgi:hypothetical protein